MTRNMLSRAWAEIDLNCVEENYNHVKELVSDNCKIMPIIKADAYGHGSGVLAKIYENLGAGYFGVATLDEALALRKDGIKSNILILGYTKPSLAGLLVENKISQTVYSYDEAKMLSDIAVAMNDKIKIHLKVDTGMSRLGLFYQRKNDEAIEEGIKICSLSGLYAEGIFTHFATSDVLDDDDTLMQFDLFMDFISKMKKRGIDFSLRHCCNSAGIINYPQMHLDMVRPGAILYGVSPTGEELLSQFKQVMSLRTRVADIRTIKQGCTIGYGRTFRAEKDVKVAALTVGYADGISRTLSNKMDFIIHGKRVHSLGRVCMDYCMADIDGVENVSRGDIATVFGRDKDEFISIEEVGRKWGTVGYEIVCMVSKRIPRLYVDKDEHCLTYID